MALRDAGWDLVPLLMREFARHNLDIKERVLITNPEMTPRTMVPREDLNIIYNVADVGINSSVGKSLPL